MPTIAELLEQKAAIERQIAEAQREERGNAIAQVKALMAQYGLTAADLSSRGPSPSRRGQPTGKVAAKYRNAATGETWSGRGLQPKWLKAQIEAGKKLDDFAI